eukprot:GHVN01103094.1.p1 GENE.GHVN01103094.1~~GHVN01103094.1.p1  ORF type:complete len:235 (+),score=72.42 GHVN01103094.1:824-1528(+)
MRLPSDSSALYALLADNRIAQVELKEYDKLPLVTHKGCVDLTHLADLTHPRQDIDAGVGLVAVTKNLLDADLNVQGHWTAIVFLTTPKRVQKIKGGSTGMVCLDIAINPVMATQWAPLTSLASPTSFASPTSLASPTSPELGKASQLTLSDSSFAHYVRESCLGEKTNESDEGNEARDMWGGSGGVDNNAHASTTCGPCVWSCYTSPHSVCVIVMSVSMYVNSITLTKALHASE